MTLWFVFLTIGSNTRISDGRIVTQEISPNRTPFAITTPRSSPILKLMKQRAMKPAMVVVEEPAIDRKVFEMACAIAVLLSSLKTFCCSS